MKKEVFWKYYEMVKERGYQSEIDWSENLKLCDTPEKFLNEYIWVVLNSGMKNQVARLIFDRIKNAIATGQPILSVFKHKGKVAAILDMALVYEEIFKMYQSAIDKIMFLETLSYIGKITKYHLAKNLGLDICKPDRHLSRITMQYKITPQELCEKLSKETGLRIATVDVVLWRAANLGLI